MVTAVATVATIDTMDALSILCVVLKPGCVFLKIIHFDKNKLFKDKMTQP